jgi:hypothetical protein
MSRLIRHPTAAMTARLAGLRRGRRGDHHRNHLIIQHLCHPAGHHPKITKRTQSEARQNGACPAPAGAAQAGARIGVHEIVNPMNFFDKPFHNRRNSTHTIRGART